MHIKQNVKKKVSNEQMVIENYAIIIIIVTMNFTNSNY